MLTPEQKAKIQQKEASMADALKRDALTNYREGYFFVTLNTRGESPILSSVVGKLGGSGKDAPHCEYTELGKKVKEVVASIPSYHPSAEVIDAEIMPEHLHILLLLKPGNMRHLGNIINGFMIGCTHVYWDTLGINWRNAESAIAQNNRCKAPQRQDRDHTHSFRGPALFVHGYNDVEALTPEQVETKREYIRTQAERRLMKGSQHECFRIQRQQHTHSWTFGVAMKAISADRFFGSNADKCREAQRQAFLRLNIDNMKQRQFSSIHVYELLGLDWIGNREWMACEKKLPLVCHRNDAWLFDVQKQAVLEKAREGWVIVSAFISPKERDVKEQLMREQLPFIEIMDNGFSDRYKPYGKAFYACAENRLVQISCWNYEYQRESHISREMCLVMNQLAIVICRKEDDWWKTK